MLLQGWKVGGLRGGLGFCVTVTVELQQAGAAAARLCSAAAPPPTFFVRGGREEGLRVCASTDKKK